jgi:hypothetical protein
VRGYVWRANRATTTVVCAGIWDYGRSGDKEIEVGSIQHKNEADMKSETPSFRRRQVEDDLLF